MHPLGLYASSVCASPQLVRLLGLCASSDLRFVAGSLRGLERLVSRTLSCLAPLVSSATSGLARLVSRALSWLVRLL